MKASRAYAAFAAATVTWALLLPAAAFLASRAHASSAGTALVVAVYAIGSRICHQLPARSFHLWTAQMPVCARCTGIYVGAALTVVSFGARAFSTFARETRERATVDAPKRQRREGGQASGWFGRSGERLALHRPALHRLAFHRLARLTLALAAAPTFATLVYEWTTGAAPSNWIRFAAGVPMGAAVVWLVRGAAENQVN